MADARRASVLPLQLAGIFTALNQSVFGASRSAWQHVDQLCTSLRTTRVQLTRCPAASNRCTARRL